MNTTGPGRYPPTPAQPTPSVPPPPASPPPGRDRHPLGLPLLGIVGLSLLAVPRAVLHDLHVVDEGSLVNLLLVVVPLVVWVVVVLRARVPRPFVTLLATGASYGVLLAVVHHLLWNRLYAQAPALGGELTAVDPAAQEVVMRVSVTVSSVVVGVAVGAVCGLVAWGVTRLRRPRHVSR
ncbi:hypothetical protein [Cellulosimicrobium cellulans]|uniref:hypothetical protein n=1 Tax=Cellulosimicrobium cellulans TaxID=1710 RepID=UPI00209AA0CA|nr:hypothetical protein [Cellulosimicrobium cellulans]